MLKVYKGLVAVLLLGGCYTQFKAVKQVDKALISLLGEDGTGLNSGVIHRMLLKLDDLEAKNKVSASWLDLVKPVAVSVAITALTTYLLTRFA